jgi:beta-glucosidase
VKHYLTINEFRSFVEAGYQVVDVKVGGKTLQLGGAPGMRLSDSELKQVRHHSVLGHGLAVEAIRSQRDDPRTSEAPSAVWGGYTRLDVRRPPGHGDGRSIL